MAQEEQTTQQAESQAQTQQETTAPGRTFTQDQVTAIVAKESKQAVEALLKDAGVAPGEDYKASLQAFRDWQDSQKTDLQKAMDKQNELEKERVAAEQKVQALEQRLMAVSMGIPADRADKYVKLAAAYMDEKTDFAKALQAAVKDFPVAQKGVAGVGANPPDKPATQTTTKALPRGVQIF